MSSHHVRKGQSQSATVKVYGFSDSGISEMNQYDSRVGAFKHSTEPGRECLKCSSSSTPLPTLQTTDNSI